MPELAPPSAPHIKQFYLPSTAALPIEQQAWIKYDVSQNLVEDMSALDDEDPNTAVRVWRVHAHRIKDWNMTRQGVLVPITYENVVCLPPEDLNFIRTIKRDSPSVAELSEDDKKK